MDMIISTDIEYVLYDVVPVCILHQFQRFVDNALHQMRASLTGRRIQTTLNDTASMSMSGHISYTGRNSIKNKLGMIIWQFEQNSLNDMIAMAVNAESGSCRCQCTGKNCCCTLWIGVVRIVGVVRVVIVLEIGLIGSTEFDDFLNGSCAVKVKRGVDQSVCYVLYE